MGDPTLVSGKVTQILRQLLWAVLAFILVTACGAAPSQVSTVHSPDATQTAPSDTIRLVKHMMGETQVPANPQRLITLDPNLLATALVLGIQPVGSVAWTDLNGQTGLDPIKPYLDDHAQELTVLGYSEVNLEKVLLVKPDLILGNHHYKAIYEQLSRIAPTVLYDYTENNFGWKDLTRFAATVLGKSQEAEKLLNDYYQRTQELRQKMGVGVASPEENRASNIQVSVINPDSNGVSIMYKGLLAGSVLEDVGLSRPPEQDKDGFHSSVSFESIPQMDGDAIFVVSYNDEDSLDLVNQLKKQPLWSQLEAVKQGKVYLVDAQHWYGSDIVRANFILDDLFKYLLDEE
ncbi:MAG: iron-siderophore ABC transporter substrate-binding protein [Leptolyngbya sp. IPPAS B-1204]|nr:MAG: iron-siderophore ABC transporter substrate-binding protein [Leptolyngbya sp. IPPAS B-1204]